MKRSTPIDSKYKNSRTIKWAKKKDESKEDIETLKESCDIIGF